MTSFVHVDQPTEHPGVSRAGAAFSELRNTRLDTVGASGLAALLLSIIVAALVVGADHLADSLEDGGLLTAWLVMWAVVFVVMALVANRVGALFVRARTGWNAYSQRRAAAAADAKFLAYARYDTRVMHELQAATTRHEASQSATLVPARQLARQLVAERSAAAEVPTLYEAMRRVNLGKYY
jgi:hypothetical protein